MIKYVYLALTLNFLIQIQSAAVIKSTYEKNLGNCLDEAWVSELKAKFQIDGTALDNKGRRIHPFARKALTKIRHLVKDKRLERKGVYQNCNHGGTFFGVGAKINSSSGQVIDEGSYNNSFVLEVNTWNTHLFTDWIVSILLKEVVGFEVTHFEISGALDTAERMSTRGKGLCSPVHSNFEVWPAGKESTFQQFGNESYSNGGVGYTGRSGLYTTTDFVKKVENTSTSNFSKTYYADFWKDYRQSLELASVFTFSDLNSTKYYPPSGKFCPDGTMGCLNQCSKSPSCAPRTLGGGNCVLISMMNAALDPGYLQAVISNNDIPAKFCFLGYDGSQGYSLHQLALKKPVLFYHWEPDLFHIENMNSFSRVQLPRAIPEQTILATGKFNGTFSVNPVTVDFPVTRIVKYTSSIASENPYLGSFISKFTLTNMHVNSMLRDYSKFLKMPRNGSDLFFLTSCSWIKNNYNTWKTWIDRLPLCTSRHITYSITGCNNSIRHVHFGWVKEDPENSKHSYECDGGYNLPSSMNTSRSCSWINENFDELLKWSTKKPNCDPSFYSYSVSECTSSGKRIIYFKWLLPNAINSLTSAECINGSSLPHNRTIDCDYTPYSSLAFVTVFAISFLIFTLISTSGIAIVVYRNHPIFVRSQYQLLLILVFGACLSCLSSVIYAGPPSYFICSSRPLVTSLSFMTMFSSLFVKSLRVYRVFMNKALRRVKVTANQMIKMLVIITAIDIGINFVWFIFDFPAPITKDVYEPNIGLIQHAYCSSESFIFQALGFFWKGLILFSGVYLSFKIRNVASDFQESVWNFASTLVVLLGSLIILPLAYIVDLPPKIFFIFWMGTNLICTLAIAVFMLVPKFLKLRNQQELYSEKTAVQTTQNGGESSEIARLKDLLQRSERENKQLKQRLKNPVISEKVAPCN